ncbi:MAG: flavin reductase family protein [Phycisphaerales bacterium]|jgi:flavin reductase (DIM6/NTAB) family NADH-FMN oxidoreductase RutF|nr:flavin reductase family protein [Phycisphaerales bacterium]
MHTALERLPTGTYVLTCGHEGRRGGVLTRWVQQCSAEPPLLVVAVPRGRPIEPMIRDARAFAICMVPNGDRLATRRFGEDATHTEDPFLALPLREGKTGSPIIESAIAWFDCQLVGHLSPDADSRLYLGEVVAGGLGTAARNEKARATTRHGRPRSRAKAPSR